jgi:hypothetical protein
MRVTVMLGQGIDHESNCKKTLEFRHIGSLEGGNIVAL